MMDNSNKCFVCGCSVKEWHWVCSNCTIRPCDDCPAVRAWYEFCDKNLGYWVWPPPFLSNEDLQTLRRTAARMWSPPLPDRYYEDPKEVTEERREIIKKMIALAEPNRVDMCIVLPSEESLFWSDPVTWGKMFCKKHK